MLDELLTTRGIAFDQNDRIHQAFSRLARYKQRVEAEPRTEPTGPEMLMLLDVTEIDGFIPFLSELEDTVLVEKWGRLKSGSADRAEETASNSDARNTQFELMLFSDLRRAGMTAAIGNPNPDISLEINNRGYSIQCKRIFNANRHSAEQSLRAAASQLTQELRESPGRLGVIALQIDRTFTEGQKILASDDRASAIASLEGAHRMFTIGHERHLRSKDVIKSPKVAGVILYSSVAGPIGSTRLVTHMTQLDISDALQNRAGIDNFAQLRHDTAPYLDTFKAFYNDTT